MQRDWWLKSNNIKKLVNKKDIYFLPFFCSAFLIQYSYQKNFYIHIPLLEYIPEMIYQKTYWWHFFSESFGSNILVYLLWNPSVCKKVSKKLVEKILVDIFDFCISTAFSLPGSHYVNGKCNQLLIAKSVPQWVVESPAIQFSTKSFWCDAF